MSSEDDLPLSLEQKLDQVCTRFEAAWKSGAQPRIEDCLANLADVEKREVLRELILLDVFYRRKRGEACQPDDYHPRFPELVADYRPPSIPGLEILGFLGEGGMGVVYKARQIRLNRIIALKMIRTHRPADASARARFDSEGQNVAKLDHPNIVCVYESGEVDGRPYFVLEFVQGGTLAQKRKDGPWAPKAAAEMVARLADAVEYAHDQQIIHRDLKPANILLTQSGVPKIADFGLSKQLHSDAGRVTHAGDCLGTPAYMPKELADGRLEAVGQGTDIFGLGAILYDLLTGRPPYDGATVEQVMEQARKGWIKPPRQLRPTLPLALERICLRALAPDPRQRYSSAGALAKDLRNYLAPARRIGQVAAVLAALVGIAVLSCMWLTMGPDNTDSNPNHASSQPIRSEGLANDVRILLKNRCYSCHGQNGSMEGGFNYVLDRDRLIRLAKIIPGKPESSLLFQRVQDGEMPPEQKQPGLAEAEIALLKNWIKEGAQDFNAPLPPREFISTAQILEFIRADLKSTNKQVRRFLRYFTITHLYNAGLSEDELQSYRSGLSKLVNSLSWEKKIVVPPAIGQARTIFRIDMRDYGWSAEIWKLILNHYPYGVIHDSDEARFCATETESPLPFLRADWFVFEAARPPLYNLVLKLPATAMELEKELGVNVAENLRRHQVARAGFNVSGISSSNRVIERHATKDGAYWRSYDFKPLGGDGNKNIFVHPLGPGLDKGSFQHDGGEIIFNLPNGLQAYLLVDAEGKRIDKGPNEIVKDPAQHDGRVINGISCMGCHTKGIIVKDDKIRDHFQENFPFLDKDKTGSIRALYVPQDILRALMNLDMERFAKAVAETKAHLSTTEPIVALASRYDWPLDLNQAAAEAGLQVDSFRRNLPRVPNLAGSLGPLLVKGTTVNRDVFKAYFGALVNELRLGQRYPPDLLTNSIGMKLKLLPEGEFMMGSPPTENGRSEKETQHKVRIGKPFFIGVYEVTQAQYRRVMGTNPSHFSVQGGGKALVEGHDTDSFPVDSVSWDHANAFCHKLSQMDQERQKGRMYHLPTEAEWEYASRAGTKTAFPFANDPFVLDEHAWYGKTSGAMTHPVGSKAPNPWGLFDMQGNVEEWCADYFDEDYYAKSPGIDPTGGPKNFLAFRVLRGGSWFSDAKSCRPAARHQSAQGYAQGKDYGFRVVLELNEQTSREIGRIP